MGVIPIKHVQVGITMMAIKKAGEFSLHQGKYITESEGVHRGAYECGTPFFVHMFKYWHGKNMSTTLSVGTITLRSKTMQNVQIMEKYKENCMHELQKQHNYRGHGIIIYKSTDNREYILKK